MLLRLVAGRAGSGKSTWIYDAVREDLKRSPLPVYVVVPEQFTLQTEKELIEALGVSGLMQARVTSPTRLADEVFTKVRQSRRTPVGPSGLAMALRAAAAGLAGELRAFRPVLGFPGFSRGMVELISEMKRFDVGPDALLQASAGARGALRAKTEDIAAIYARYEQYLLARNYIDADDRFNGFIDAIAQAAFFSGCSFYFDGFDYLPPQHCRMIGQLLSIAEAVTVSLEYDGFESEDSGLFQAAKDNIARLTGVAGEAGAETKWVHVRAVARRSGMPPDIAHLERALFVPGAAKTRRHRGDVTVVRAASAEEEVEAAAAWIVEKVRTGGLHWRQVAVQCCDLPAFAPLVDRIFGRYGIPAFIDRRKPVVGHAGIRFILALLRVLERGYRGDDALRLVKTGYAGVSGRDADRLEMYLSAFSPRGRRAWSAEWTKGRDLFDLAALNNLRGRVFGLCNGLAEGAGGRRVPCARWASALFAALERAELERLLDEEALALRNAGLVEESAVTERIWNAAVELLDELSEIAGDEALDAGELRAILQSGFETVEAGIIPTGVDQVQVGSIGRSKYSGLRHMLIIGARDGSLSEDAGGGGILTDREVDAMAGLGVCIGRGSALKASQKRFALYETITKGADGLYVSWSPEPGGEPGPDRIVGRVLELLETPLDAVPEAAELLRRPSVAGGSFGRLPSVLRACAEGELPDAAQAGLLKWFLNDPSYSLLAGEYVSSLFGSAPPECLKAAGVALGGAATVSASQLESYAECPYRHFVEYVLRPVPWRESGVERADAGMFLHAAMERFGRRLAENRYDAANLGASAAAIMDEEAALLAREFNWGLLESSGKHRWIGGNLRRICSLAAASFLRQLECGAFVPVGQELRFGRGGMPAARLPAEGAPAFLTGRIDRVDVFSAEDADWLRVVDYKSGRASMRLEDAVNGLDQQLWLYLAALREVWQRFRRRPGRPAGAFLFPLADPWVDEGADEEGRRMDELRLSGWCLDDPAVVAAMDRVCGGGRSALYTINPSRGAGVYGEAEVAAVLRIVEENAAGAVAEMRRGRMGPRPWRRGADTACDGCPYGASCRFGVQPARQYRKLLNKKEVDGLVGGGEGADGDGMDR